MCLVNTEKEQGQTGQQQQEAAAAAARRGGGKLTNASSRASTFTTLESTSISTSEDSSRQQSQTNTLHQNHNSHSHSHTRTCPSPKVIFSWCILTLLSKEFSVFLPKFQSQAGAKTFIPAAYQYDEEHTFFDNTILTWGTDYAICVIMLYAAYLCLNATTTHSLTKLIPTDSRLVRRMDPSKSQALRMKSACLFLSYALSVFAGGYAHYTFTGGVNQLNTLSFRIWWSICVGSVTAAGGFMGACGSEICKRFHHEERSQCNNVFRLVYVPDVLWMMYGGYLTWVCLMGGISYKRPACDIFVAGTSQFVPTVYCILAVGSVRWKKMKEERGWNGNTVVHGAIRRWYRCMFYIGFALNAPLLPSYPCYIQYTSLSLGVVNAILHLNLTLAWGMQALSLRHICQAFNLVEEEEEDGGTIPAASSAAVEESPSGNDNNKQKYE